MKEKWIFLTFWTKPMLKNKNKNKIATNVLIAYISCYYAHLSGYKIRMYTDTKGKELLKDILYDEINTLLDEIPDSIPSVFFSYAKFFALLREPLGTIHTDFDVFIKKPCLDDFFNNKEYDLILQNKEVDQNNYGYVQGRNLLNKIGRIVELPISYIGSSNVGTIGFNNQQLKDEYLHRYMKAIEYYAKYEKDFESLEYPIDLIFEQSLIDWLAHCYNVYYILPNILYGIQLTNIANKIGYTHLLGAWKHTLAGKKEILEKYNLIKNN